MSDKNKSMVLCAPTGSGKTVVFEMAIIQLLMEIDDRNFRDDFKIIYMAPVKALCTERLTEWYPKFTKLGLLCIEVTGDTDVEFPQLKPYRIIITTPEKWDMLTRRWKDHKGLVEVVKLFLIDEVHILNDQIRGPVLEAVVSRMKTIESSAQSSHRIEQLQRHYQGTSTTHIDIPAPRIRFVAISATVGNPEDVAAWLGTRDKPAVVYRFGDESRPVKLKRVVEGYPCPEGASIFKFDIILNYKLWPIIQKYHNGKPTLIFCNTRKSVHLTAETLSREITVGFSPEQKAKLMNLASTIKTKKIQSLLLSGVGCHHAGLLFEERHVIEQAFRNRDLPILVTTTTLAMGVNLPAHLVIIKNTQQYFNGAYQEYSISTVLQMVGRAGRPQFDTEATAVIMTRMADKHRYEALVGGSEPLQSYLHKRIAENLNSEAALGTVADVAQCVQWLNSTFLSVRAARDPKRYLGLPQAAPATQISKKIEELCVKAMNGLATAGLISMDDACCISSTEAGRLMSLYYLDLETMKLIMKVDGSESLERLLWLICESHELSDMHLRVDERRCLNSLNRNRAAATIRFPMKGKINSRQMKLNCIIQAVLGCLPIPDPSLNQEAMKILRTADRVCKCLVSYVTRPNLIDQRPKFFSAVLNSIILAKCISAQLWENSPYVSKQLKGIGPAFSTLLASAGKVNFALLEESHPRDLERIINKGAPAGNILRKQISLLPNYSINIVPVDKGIIRVQLCLLNQTQLADNMDNLTAGANHTSYIVVGDSDNCLIHYSSFRDSNLISVYNGCIDFEVERRYNHGHKIMVHCISSNIVGIDDYREYVFEDLNNLNIDGTRSTNIERITEINDAECLRKRKRKNEICNEIAQSKEKKKRDNNLMEKIKYLKESFSKATKDIRVNLNRTKEFSDSLLQNILKKEHASKNNESDFVNLQENLSEKCNEIFPCEDFMDDEEIGNILHNIECEINADKARKTTKSENHTIVDKNKNIEISKETPEKNIDRTVNKNSYQKVKRTNLLGNNNYNFLDMLEKNAGDDNDSQLVGETSLPNTVRYQIDKYLQSVQSTSNLASVLEVPPQISFIGEDSTKSLNGLRQESYTHTNKTNENIESPKIYKENVNNVLNQVNRGIDNYNATNEYNDSLDQRSDVNVCKLDNVVPIDTKTKDDSTWTILNNCNMARSFSKNENLSNSCSLAKEYLDDLALIPTKTIKHVNTGNIRHINNMVEETNMDLVPKIMHYSKQHSGTSTDNGESYKKYEYMNNYFYSTTQISVISEKTSKHKVQIIRKLKVDLDVTKIVYKDNNEYSKNHCTTEMINELDNTIVSSNNDNGNTIISTSIREGLSMKPVIDNEFEQKSPQIKKNHSKNSSTPTREDLTIEPMNEDEFETKRLRIKNINPVTYSMFTSNDVSMAPMVDNEFEHERSQIKNINPASYSINTREDLSMKRSNENEFEDKRLQTKNISPVNSVPDIIDRKINKHNVDYTKISASDIIKKYREKFSSNKQYTELQENVKSSTSNNDIKLQLVKPKKKYRISNLQNIKISLPGALTFKQSSNCINKKQDYEPHIGHERNYANATENAICSKFLKHDESGEQIIKFSPCVTEVTTQNEPLAKSNSPDLLLDLHKSESESDIDIHESMFDPKNLLQCLSKEDESEIIPPPLEYCDSGLYSPVMFKNDLMTSNSIGNLYQVNEIAFNPNDDPRSKEIETCILSQYDDATLLDKNFYSHFSMTPKHTRNIQSPFFNQRQAKLDQFKFKGKNKLK